MIVVEPLTVEQEIQIRVLWQMEIDTAEIAELLELDEWRIEPVVRAYVAGKKGRKASD